MNCLCFLCLLGLCQSLNTAGSPGTPSCGAKNALPAANTGGRRTENGRERREGFGFPFADTVPDMEPKIPYSAVGAAYSEGCQCQE